MRQPAAEQAWARFSELYTPLLYYWARSQRLTEADAADLVQEVFLVLVKTLPRFHYKQDGSFRAWLRTITLNKHREWKRRKRPQPLNPDFDQGQDDPQSILDEKEHRQFIVNQMLEIVRPDFPPSTWQLFDDYVIQGRKPQEVAAFHKVTPGTVYAAKCAVLHRLRSELKGLID